jgi:hypothetical protein
MKFAFFLLLMLSITGCMREQASWPTTRFDSQSWKLSEQGDRYVFVRDLLDRKLLLRKSSAQVHALLGKPSSIDPSKRQLSCLIKIGGSGFDSMYILDVLLDQPNGTVQEVGIRGD